MIEGGDEWPETRWECLRGTPRRTAAFAVRQVDRAMALTWAGVVVTAIIVASIRNSRRSRRE